MKVPIAPGVVAGSLRDAARLLLPARYLLAERRVDQLAAAATQDDKDILLRRWSRRVMRALDVRVHSSGLDEIGPGPYVVAAIHEGLVDVPILVDNLPIPMSFVARDSLDAELPASGLLAASGQIVIDPESPLSLRVLLRAGAEHVAAGRSLAMFPQGSVLGIETAFQPGPFIVAERLNLPVLPVALWGSHQIWQHPFAPDVIRAVDVRLAVLPPRRVASRAEYRELERELKRLALADTQVLPRRYEPARDGFWDGYNFDIDPDFTELAARVAEHRDATAGSYRPGM